MDLNDTSCDDRMGFLFEEGYITDDDAWVIPGNCSPTVKKGSAFLWILKEVLRAILVVDEIIK